MLEFLDIQQNTDEWFALRAGRITSSNLGKVMANYGKAFGEPAKKYALNIAIEQITGEAVSSGFSNEHMERGHLQEPIARMLYEEETFSNVTNGGFFFDDVIGCSPDGMVGEGCIEIKSVIPHVHFSNIKRGGVDPAYKWQCIANLMFTGSEWLDFVSYCETFPAGKRLFRHRITREENQDNFLILENRIKEFLGLIKNTKKIIEEN